MNAGQHGISRPDAGTEKQDSVKTDKYRLQTKADNFKLQNSNCLRGLYQLPMNTVLIKQEDIAWCSKL